MGNARVSTLRDGAGEVPFVGAGVPPEDVRPRVPVADASQDVPTLDTPDTSYGGRFDGPGDVNDGVRRGAGPSATSGGQRPQSSAEGALMRSSSSRTIRNSQNESEEGVSSDDSQDSEEGAQGHPRQVNPYLRQCSCIGRAGYVEKIWEVEWDFHKGVLLGLTEDEWHTPALRVLLATEDKLFELILEGNVQKARKQDVNLKNLLNELRTKGDHQPCHYLWEFVDGNGDSPTPRQILDIVEVAERYMDSSPADYGMVQAVDNWAGDGWTSWDIREMRKGARRYLQKEAAEENLTEFLANLKNFLRGEPQAEPLRQPLREVGYTHKAAARIDSHEKHQSSNYLMNLFEAIAAAWLEWDFRNKAAVISICFEPAQAALGEIVWSCLTQAYTKTGRGFSHAPAGLSARSAEAITSEKWNEWQWYALEETPFQANLQKERELLKRAREERDELLVKRDRLQAEMLTQRYGPGTATQQSPDDEDLPTDAYAEFVRMDEAGEFETAEDRQLAIDTIRPSMVLRKEQLEKLVSVQERVNHILQGIKDREGWE